MEGFRESAASPSHQQVRAQRKALDLIEEEVRAAPSTTTPTSPAWLAFDVAVMFAAGRHQRFNHQDPSTTSSTATSTATRSFVDACESKSIMAWAGMPG